MYRWLVFTGLCLIGGFLGGCNGATRQPVLVPVSLGWANTSVNAVIFRTNSIVTHNKTQYVAFYDTQGFVTLGKREVGSLSWQLHKTQYQGNVRDAHNCISIMVDGDGFLHMAWDHHNNSMRYSRSIAPGSLEMSSKMSMTGIKENHVTYPEFYRLVNGDLVFFYRDGTSGRGNLMMNYYDTQTQTWSIRQDSFISGEDQRNAYWQACVDEAGTIHVSWVWRESGDVATNHDLCYAKSEDGGRTWLKSSGKPYSLPITAANAEYAWKIPQRSELINQTSMCADSQGRPYIATYWRSQSSTVPQFRVVFFDGKTWQTQQVSQRSIPFSLSGSGTKRIPISRPKIMADCTGNTDKAYLVFRDEERDSRVSVARCDDLSQGKWKIQDLTDFPVGQWEPSYDTELWKSHKILNLFVQNVGQGDSETLEVMTPQLIYILSWTP
ncbi:MAG: BNR repeat-containing protein [Sedimentisphaerales bacterium]|nr:BNR repeat-containing protein [Sedimentisphaerales bacterium]